MRREGVVGLTIASALAVVMLPSCTLTRSSGTSESAGTFSTGSPSSSGSSASSVAFGGLSVDQPSSWRADPRTWRVTLSWEAPSGFEVDHYAVERDGKTVSDDVAETRFTDEDAEPGVTYRYEVRAVDAGGAESQPGVVSVETGTPAVADARLEGRFVMKLHIISQSGLQSGARGGGIVFVFDPTCGSGPCNVVWSRQGSGGSGTLGRRGASYAGTVHAPFYVRSCQGGVINETLVFHLRVSDAEAFHGAWRASKVEGTLDESASAFGCVTARLSYRLTGFAQR
jgi:hypothetical protein